MTYEEKLVILIKSIKDAKDDSPPGDTVDIERNPESPLWKIDTKWIDYILKELERENVIRLVGTGINPEEKSISYGLELRSHFNNWYEDYKTKHIDLFDRLNLKSHNLDKSNPITAEEKLKKVLLALYHYSELRPASVPFIYNPFTDRSIEDVPNHEICTILEKFEKDYEIIKILEYPDLFLPMKKTSLMKKMTQETFAI